MSGKSVQRGDQSPMVERIQGMLDLLGYDPGAIDGYFGRRTEEAVLDFQEDYGLKVTGVVDDKTQRALSDACDDDAYDNDEYDDLALG